MLKNCLKTLFLCALTTLFAAVACTPQETIPTGSTLEVTQINASSTSVTIEWEEKTKCDSYQIAIYNRRDSRYPLQKYDLELGANTPRAFSFPLLAPRTSYNVQVIAKNGANSGLVSVTTSAAESMVEGDVILQNFNNLCWGYDFMNNACGVKLTSVVNSYAPNSLEDTMAKWEVTTFVGAEDELFKFTKTSMHKLLGIEGWSHGGKVFHRPGHARLGTSSEIGRLRTPAATLLPVSGREIVVDFKVCPYTLGTISEVQKIKVRLIDKAGNTVQENLVEIPESETHPSWSTTTTSFDMMSNGQHIEFESCEGQPLCIDDIRVYYPIQIEGEDVYGYVVDSYRKPIKGVVVSDGFSVTTTDAEGFYTLTPISDTYHIFISVPSAYEIPINEYGQPCFFKRYSKNTRQYDFTLTPLKSVENEFALFGFGDPQVSSSTGYNRFTKEAVPKIKAYASTFTIPVYGITAGDIVSVTNTSNATSYMPRMRDAMHVDKIGMPVFQVMGNHDNVYFNANRIIEADETSSTFNLKAQRDFERYFGPANYSFNRGKVHIIGMRDIIYNQNNDSSKYSKGFTNEQFKWLEQDLKYVPRDMMVVLVVHIPLWTTTSNNILKVHRLFKEFNEAHIISGHMHYRRNYDYTAYKTFEHNIGAVCGSWWSSCICGDGSPNGYEVFIAEGNRMKKWYHMGYPDGMDDPNNQMRLYRGNALIGGDIVGDNVNGTMGMYAFNFADDVILANVFDSDPKWSVSVYEDGVKTGEMTWLTASSYITGLKATELIGSYTKADPRRAPDGRITSHDFWAHGFQMGVLGRKPDQNASWSPCYNMWTYKLKNKNAKVEVVARDRFGNEYRCSHFSDSEDYKYVKNPVLY